MGITVPGADALFHNINISTDFPGTLAQGMSAQCSSNDMNDGRLPWDNIYNDKWQKLLQPKTSVDYSVVSPSLDVQATTGADELLQHIMSNIPPKDQPFFTAELTDIWSSDEILPSGMHLRISY